jgi:predicted DNA-binding transcriptional regulator AlpA
MLHSQTAPAVLPMPPRTTSPLGILDFGDIARALGISSPTLERLIRSDQTFPKLFRIGNKRHCRFDDLQHWVDEKARGDA